ncbi:MAG: UDP-N-acetylglucosamine 2-epimerase (non-hydrolyzing), partial [Calditrichia bacterium]|nr:UDP-N-acetylglucosamine 2-epimerase (non-hydrolyzing) [Calditrichia bacterium]
NKIKKENKTFQELKEIDFNKKIILVTGHRRENFGQDFINICNALKNIAMHNKDVEIVYPVHLNPNVQKPVYSLLKNIDNIKLIEPLNYEPFVFLMVNSYFIISDSGGIQEEAPSLDKPVLVTRNVTERPEAVRTGAVKLVGTSEKKIFKEAMLLLNDSEVYNRMAKAENPFGDGTACAQTVKSMDKYLF